MRPPALAVLVLGLLLAAPATAAPEADAPQADAPAADAVARTFLGHLAAEDFATARSMLDDAMTEALPEGRLEALWAGIVARVGALASLGAATTREAGAYRVVDLPVTFETSVLDVRVSVDAAGRVGGLFFVGEHPRRDPAAEVVLATPTGDLHGTLELPLGDGPFPAVVLVAGSGPTDRDGNGPLSRNDALKQLAEALGERGFAVLRYDKRGVGASAPAAPAEKDLRFGMLVDDALAWIRWLARQPHVARVGIVGHSEGALIAALAAAKAKDEAEAYVSLAGPGRPAADVLRTQLADLPAPLAAARDRILAALTAGETTADVPDALAPLFRPSVQPYLVSWMAEDPVGAVAGLSVPTLVVQGTTDRQVGVEDARRLAGARPGVELLLVDGMNHVLKPARTDEEQARTYQDPDVALAPTLAPALARFLEGALRPRTGPATPAGD